MYGGMPVRRAMQQKRKMNETDYKEAGKWIDAELKKKDVWKCCQVAPRKYRVCGEFSVK